MTAIPLTSAALKGIKRAIGREYPQIRSAHITEAIACGLGCQSHAALLPQLDKRPADDPEYCHFDGVTFVRRASELSGVEVNGFYMAFVDLAAYGAIEAVPGTDEVDLGILFHVDGANEARFRLTEALEGTSALNRLLDQYGRGDMIGKDFVDHLKTLLKQFPKSIDTHAHLGTALFEQGLMQEGLKFGKRGLKLGLQAMPKGFNGTLSWYEMGNRPFLRAAHMVALAQRELGKTAESEKLLRQMLQWNPSDNHGVRFLLEEASADPRR